MQFIGGAESGEEASAEGEYHAALDHFEREYFASLLRKFRWNAEEAARQAGINVVTLYRKIKKYQLRKESS